MIKSQLGLIVLCLLISAPILAEEIIFWELGVAIEKNSHFIKTPDIQHLQNTITITEQKLGIASKQSMSIIKNIRNNKLTHRVTKHKNIDTEKISPTFNNAKLAFLSGKYFNAIDIYETLTPQSPSVNYWHAMTHFRLGNFQKALYLIELSKNKTDETLFLKGTILRLLNKKDDALACFNKLLSAFPASDYESSSKIQIAMLDKHIK